MKEIFNQHHLMVLNAVRVLGIIMSLYTWVVVIAGQGQLPDQNPE
jgi:hypothetical protein